MKLLGFLLVLSTLFSSYGLAESFPIGKISDACSYYKASFVACAAERDELTDAISQCQEQSSQLQEDFEQSQALLASVMVQRDGALEALGICNTKGSGLTNQVEQLKIENDALKENLKLPDNMLTAMDLGKCIKFLGKQASRRTASLVKIKKMKTKCTAGKNQINALVTLLQGKGFKISLVQK